MTLLCSLFRDRTSQPKRKRPERCFAITPQAELGVACVPQLLAPGVRDLKTRRS